jgi:cytochrome P450
MLSRLLDAKDDAGRGMGEQQLLDEAITVLVAGHETTALTLCYALDQLARHPTELAALERELAEVLAGRSPRFEDVPRLRYCGAVVKETLRLYPPAWATGREVVTELTLGGVKLAPGTLLLVAPWIIHRDERFFREPLRFRPDRWLNGETEGLPKLAYFPFGAGPRVCIGSHFAELEAALVLATLTSRCTFNLTSEAPLLLAPSVTLRPRGPMEMRVGVRDRPS